MSIKILDLTDLIQGGIQPSLFGSKAALWIDGKNVVFQKSGIRPLPGQISVAGKLSYATPTGAIEARIAGARTIFWGTVRKTSASLPGKIYRLKEGEGTPTDVSRTTGPSDAADYDLSGAIQDSIITQDATTWSFAQWGSDQIIATDGVHPVQLYTATSGRFQDFDAQASAINSATTVTLAPSKAEIVARLQQFAMLISTTNGKTVVEWSSEDNITGAGSWDPTAINEAGNLSLHEMNSPIVCAKSSADGLWIYGTDQLFLVYYVGPPFYFGYKQLLDGIGAVGKNSVCSVGREQYGVSQRGLWITDGTQPNYIDDPSIRDYLFQQGNAAGTYINKEQISKVFVWHDPTQSSVNFFYPKKDSKNNDWGVGYNYQNKSAHIFGYGRSVCTSGEIFYWPFLFDVDGNIFQEVVGDSAPSIGSSPLALEAVYNLTTGYGVAGYGDGLYGGLESGTG